MPIDKSLSKIGSEGSSQNAGKTADYDASPYDIFGILREYVRLRADNKPDFEVPAIQMLSRWIKFTSGLMHRIIIPKEQLLGLIMQKNPDLHYLLSKTDLEGKLDDNFFVGHEMAYRNFPLPVSSELAEILNYQNVRRFESSGGFVIPNAAFLSFFVNDGEKIRKYAAFLKPKAKSNRKLVLYFESNRASLNLTTNFDIFDIRALRNFCEQTGTSQIYSMLDDVNKLERDITLIKQNIRDSRDNPTGAMALNSALFARLKQYTPELVYEG